MSQPALVPGRVPVTTPVVGVPPVLPRVGPVTTPVAGAPLVTSNLGMVRPAGLNAATYRPLVGGNVVSPGLMGVTGQYSTKTYNARRL